MKSLKTKTINTSLAKEPREPFMRLVKRDNANFAYKFLVRAVAVCTSFLIILLFAKGVTEFSFAQIWNFMKQGAFGTEFYTTELFKDMMMLLCISLALAPSFKMKFWNIGAQGQVLMGALLAATIMWYFPEKMSSPTMIFVMFLFAVVAGGMWALIPAFFKVKINANETLFTLMMNYIAIQLVKCCIDTWKGKNSALPLINSGSQTGWVPQIFGTSYGLTFLLIALLTVIMFVYMRYTKHGYEISVVGESLNTARYAGINTKKVIMRTLFLSGAICGLCGFLYVGDVNHSIAFTTGGSYGFTAIIVAWASKFNPFVMALMSFAIVFLEWGSTGIINNAGNLNSYTAYIVVGIFLFFVIGCEFFINYRIIFNSKITSSVKNTNDKIRAKMPKTTAALKKTNDWVNDTSLKCTSAVRSFAGTVVAKLGAVAEVVISPIRKASENATAKYKNSKFANDVAKFKLKVSTSINVFKNKCSELSNKITAPVHGFFANIKLKMKGFKSTLKDKMTLTKCKKKSGVENDDASVANDSKMDLSETHTEELQCENDVDTTAHEQEEDKQ